MSILTLPVEITTAILADLNFQDLLKCQKICRRFDDIVKTSSRLQYNIELQVAGLLDNPRCKLPIADRLDILRNREEAWASLQHGFTTTVKVPRPSSGLYDVTSGVYFLGIAGDDSVATTGVQSVQQPRSQSEVATTSWRNFNMNKDIVDFGTSIEEHDLIAALTSTEDMNFRYTLDIHFLRYSTGMPHDLAERPVIPITHVGNLASVSIEICGENLCVIVISNLDPAHIGYLHVYNWKKGTQKGAPLRTFNLGLVFLREDVLLTPNVTRGSLDIYYIPPSKTNQDLKRIQLIQRLQLPDIAVAHQIASIQCRCEPNPTAGSIFPRYIPEDVPFINNPEDAMMLLAIDIQQYGTLIVRPFVMLVHRRSLMAQLPENWSSKGEEDHVNTISWDDWGPHIARWLNADEFATVFITSTSGQRFVTISVDAPEIPDHIHLFDFNPYHVRKAKASGALYPRVDKVVSADDETDQECKSFGVFSGNITSKLPYIHLSSDDYYSYEAVLIDQERIIGISASPHAVAIDAVDVLHYG